MEKDQSPDEEQIGNDEADEAEGGGSGPDKGPTMSVAGAMPSGSRMAHWNTSQAQADASRPGTMPKSKSEPLPGEKDHDSKNQV